ncbi:hypothetical protein OEZ85_007721 [Tetradesmus obliquus]|uniref:Protein kinase domain-containing protein n=1 Tax=Tetradesmus obliquus TaxID=3088 RepID=A0ABY8TGT3_TETOB|nr:hypothetical protein OEZ85_007721 [Tetradesmus obliquus]
MLHKAQAGHTRMPALASCFQDFWRNVKERPVFMLAMPVLTFLVLCSLSVAGVVLGANKFESDQRNAADAAALDWAASFRLSTEKIFTPLVTLAILIQQNPDLQQMRKTFPEIAAKLMEEVNRERVVIQELQITPMGVISIIEPKNNDTDTRIGINLFKQPALRGGALRTIEAREYVTNGPLQLVQGNYGTIARIPIFIQNSTLNETFGTNKTLPDECAICFNATTKEKFWGFATAIGPLDDLRAGNDTRLDLLKQKGYKWLMTRPYTATERNDSKLYRPEWTAADGEYIFANSSSWPSQRTAVSRPIHIGNAQWELYLEPQGGWRPSWEHGAIAAVVLGSAVLALLVATIMALWAQQQRLLGDVLERNTQLAETTAKLQEEKLRLDALLVRQYNLLAILGKQGGSGGRSGGRGGGGGIAEAGETSIDSSETSSKEGLTLERIEAMRRTLAVSSNSSVQDMESIQTTELLGEGTFGKVYKGLWRGTVVAVKTMLLPANMSGAEKREKMAVMEAAISSSLSHPNIVQTYTYAIRPMREHSQNIGTLETMTDIMPTATGNGIATIATGLTNKSSSSGGSAVHSYEVRLVLEYCDKGCLRDALDSALFRLGADAINYLAVLDTAADVAKAMLHLHSCNVLHSDLKARNVMLSTGNADGRGIVGKVGDFGLSLKMDHMETHVSNVYQGTLTHMAPEIMLDGRVSKAADVYAFGITLWEMYTGGRAFEGVPRALLGHQITREHKRPRFPDSAPWAYRDLAERCWQPNWQERPTFEQVLRELQALRAADAQPTPALHVVLRPPRVLAGSTPSAKGSDGSPPVSSGNQPNGAHSTPITPTLTRLGPAAPATATGDASFYLEHSIDEDVIVMNSLTDWSMGPSGITQQQQQQLGRPGGNGSGGGNGGGWRGSLRASRSLLMPQIVEGPGEGHDGGGDSSGAARRQQQQQRLDAGRAAAEAQLASMEGQAQRAQLQ